MTTIIEATELNSKNHQEIKNQAIYINQKLFVTYIFYDSDAFLHKVVVSQAATRWGGLSQIMQESGKIILDNPNFDLWIHDSLIARVDKMLNSNDKIKLWLCAKSIEKWDFNWQGYLNSQETKNFQKYNDIFRKQIS